MVRKKIPRFKFLGLIILIILAVSVVVFSYYLQKPKEVKESGASSFPGCLLCINHKCIATHHPSCEVTKNECSNINSYCYKPPNTPKPTPKPTKKTCSELGLDVTDKNKRKRQCKCADCDVPGSKLCVYGEKEYQCCNDDHFWAHGGCCDKNKVFCGCSSKFSGTLLFCNDNDKDLKPYGNVILKYPSRSGTCPIKLCP